MKSRIKDVTIKYFYPILISLSNIQKYLNSIRNKKDIIELRMLLYSHSLEKGMCLKHVKKAYGLKKAELLISSINQYCIDGNSMKKYVFIESMSALLEYIRYQKLEGVDVSSIEDAYNKIIDKYKLDLKCFENNFGTLELTKEDLLEGTKCEFEKLVKSRHSIRNFKEENISKDEISYALEMASLYPSACNRQTIKVYYSSFNEKNKIISDVIPGNSGFQNDIHNYLIITSKINLFEAREMYQWYVNGGIYISYLVLSLHSIGIGSCIFQWSKMNRKEKKLRELVNISCEEEIIAIIGIGYYQDNNKCAHAMRKSIDEILINF